MIRRWLLKRRIRKARALLIKIDASLVAMNAPKWKRKQIWRDFIRSQEIRDDALDLIKAG